MSFFTEVISYGRCCDTASEGVGCDLGWGRRLRSYAIPVTKDDIGSPYTLAKGGVRTPALQWTIVYIG